MWSFDDDPTSTSQPPNTQQLGLLLRRDNKYKVIQDDCELIPSIIIAQVTERLQRVFKRAYRRGFTLGKYELETLAEKAQFDLFRNSCSQDHCLNYVRSFNTKPTGAMKLRSRCHQLSLPTICLEYNKKTFHCQSIIWICISIFSITFNRYGLHFVHFIVNSCVFHVWNKLISIWDNKVAYAIK